MTKEEVRDYLAENLTKEDYEKVLKCTDVQLLNFLVDKKLIINSESTSRVEGEEKEQYKLRRQLLQMRLKKRLKHGPAYY